MTWDALALSDDAFRTDKASMFLYPHGWVPGHDYLKHYEAILGKLPVRRLLEIGVAGGHSLRLWAEVFPAAQIIGLDITPTAASHRGGRINVCICDASDSTAVAPILGEPFQVIIDDGSHEEDDVAASFALFGPHLTTEGHYFIEDMPPGFFINRLIVRDPWVVTMYPSLRSDKQCLAHIRRI